MPRNRGDGDRPAIAGARTVTRAPALSESGSAARGDQGSAALGKGPSSVRRDDSGARPGRPVADLLRQLGRHRVVPQILAGELGDAVRERP
ncbi:hypothetical protein GCM10011588_38080 [Nocardia jinanensis]|uniref:Uncharacterized protein n=1 Tax=Nocardia jinanensis TaxID=382504 RepID=A0A917VW19_9NOCA|nr:hypothetical protein GCM10011588_38080 [Nocardia jinanensis]